jgi:antitoxin component YwqK of YwqJK toxin-antitoxin module
MLEENYKNGMLHGTLKNYYEDGGMFEVIKYNYGTPKFMEIYSEDGTLSDEKGFFDKAVIDKIIG